MMGRKAPTLEDIEEDWVLVTESLMDAVRAIYLAGRARHWWQRKARRRAVLEASRVVHETMGAVASGQVSAPSIGHGGSDHYTEGRRYDPIAAIDAWGLDFHLGNALKYVARAGRKDDTIQDLRKAVFYLDHVVSRP